MADTNAGTTTPATTEGSKGKGKGKRTPMSYELLDVETLKSLMDRAAQLPSSTVVYVQLPSPPGVHKDKPVRKDYERGVLAELEAGNNAKLYNERKLCVAQMGPVFQFKAVVKEETIRKVSVKKV